MNSVVLADIFKALSHPSRVEILDFLKTGPLTTGDLSNKFNVSRYAVMKHLQILEDCGLVIVRRKGRTRLNYLNAGFLNISQI
ncbi:MULTISPECIES: helix-turn-helix transcriptional regulator [unclassified Bacillus (in: firmicutes)]|uniref:ArsR/SmtB family transcription factor n=1 Tax=unclassified Bacillus (in: firmicutes) TaxID=185979 RepID=UPI0008DEB53D|nr:Helix-turn-helix domain-containing protein [Bacillus sp. UNCCL13]SFQ84039.1 Helix-turn-helix domain-containing protein [Bacillus sp. cl95]